MSKYSYSLDVGEDLDNEVSVPKGLEKYEQEFKELVADKPAKKEEKKEVKTSKPAKKEEKKEEKKEAKISKPAKKEEKEEKKMEAEPVAKEELKDEGSRWTIPVLIILIILAVVIYVIQGMQAIETPNGDLCTLKYINEKDGVSLDWQNSNDNQKFWIRKALTTNNEARAVEILHMLGCKTADISQKADPANYVDCKTPPIYIVISDAVVQAVKAETQADAVIVSLVNKQSKTKYFNIAYATDNPKLVTWRVN